MKLNPINGMNVKADRPWIVPPPQHMLGALGWARHVWPGELDCTNVVESGPPDDYDPKDYDEPLSWDSWGKLITLEFAYDNMKFVRIIPDCCPDEHVAQAFTEAIAAMIANAKIRNDT